MEVGWRVEIWGLGNIGDVRYFIADQALVLLIADGYSNNGNGTTFKTQQTYN